MAALDTATSARLIHRATGKPVIVRFGKSRSALESIAAYLAGQYPDQFVSFSVAPLAATLFKVDRTDTTFTHTFDVELCR